MSSIENKKIIVIYHANCTDGFSAAWAAWKHFGANAGYLPVSHHEPIPEWLTDKEIYFLDIVYAEPELKDIIKKNKKVVVIDHHVTREKEAGMADDGLYDINHSGAVLAWKYFHPDKKTPQLLKYVEDQDLWKFEEFKAKELTAFLAIKDFDFKTWSRLAKNLEDNSKRREYIEKGQVIIEFQARLVDEIADRAEEVEFEGNTAWVANSPVLKSEVGNELVKRHDTFSVIWSRGDGHVSVSLRSDDHLLDVGELADKYGGGGHRNSAGFSLEGDESLPWKIVE